MRSEHADIRVMQMAWTDLSPCCRRLPAAHLDTSPARGQVELVMDDDQLVGGRDPETAS